MDIKTEDGYPLPKRNKQRPKYGEDDSFTTSFSDDEDEGAERGKRRKSSNTGGSNSKVKEPCRVCGDEVSGYHYGVRTCEGCKAFFRRTIQKNKKYSCRGDQNCSVERMGKARTQRCCYCRFQECVKAGMKIDAVRHDRARGCPASAGGRARSKSQLQSDNDQDQEAEEEPKPKPKRARTSYASPAAPAAAPKNPGAKPARKSRQGKESHSGVDDYDGESGAAPPDYGRIPKLVAQMKSTVVSEDEWKSSLLAVTDEEIRKKPSAGALEMICRILDNKVYGFVEWARDSTFFDTLDYEDQKKLLQFGWNSYLMFDFVYHLQANIIPELKKLPSGAELRALELAALGHANNIPHIQNIIQTVRDLGMTRQDYLNMKMILLLNPYVPNLVMKQPIKWAYDKCQEELKQDSANSHPHMPNRFKRFMDIVTEMRKYADEGEQFLYNKVRSDGYLDDTLLLEMIEMKRES